MSASTWNRGNDLSGADVLLWRGMDGEGSNDPMAAIGRGMISTVAHTPAPAAMIEELRQ